MIITVGQRWFRWGLGGVGVFAVQLARLMGPGHVIDYNREHFTARGLFIPLEIGLRELVQALMTSIRGGKRVIANILGDSAKDMDYLSGLLERGEIRPVIDAVYPLENIAEAHLRVEGRHKTGAVVVSVSNPVVLGLAAE